MDSLPAPSCPRSEIHDPKSEITLSPADASLLQLTLDGCSDIAVICEKAGIDPFSFLTWMGQPHIHEAIDRHIDFAQRQADAKVQEALARALPEAIACLAATPPRGSRRVFEPVGASSLPNLPALNHDDAISSSGPSTFESLRDNDAFRNHPQSLADHFYEAHDREAEEEMDRWLDSDDDDWDDEGEYTDIHSDSILAAITARYFATQPGSFHTGPGTSTPSFHTAPGAQDPASFQTEAPAGTAPVNVAHADHSFQTETPQQHHHPAAADSGERSFHTEAPDPSPSPRPEVPNSASRSFQTDAASLQVCHAESTLWFTQSQLAALFKLTHQDVGHHVRHVLSAGELPPASIRYIRIAAADGKQYRTRHCSLDMVFAVARRLRWPAATSGAANFREWLAATHPEFLAALPSAA